MVVSMSPIAQGGSLGPCMSTLLCCALDVARTLRPSWGCCSGGWCTSVNVGGQQIELPCSRFRVLGSVLWPPFAEHHRTRF